MLAKALGAIKSRRLLGLQPQPEPVLLAARGHAIEGPFGGSVSFAKKKKRKAAPRTTPKAAPKAAPQVAPKKVKRKLPAPQKKKKGATGTVRAERFFAGLSERIAGEGYTRADYGRFGILAGSMLVILYYAFSAGGYFVAQRSYGGLWILYLIVLGLLFGLQVRGRISNLGWAEIGIFGAFALWNLASVTWSYSPSKSFDEFVRAALYLAGFGIIYLYMARREWLAWLGHLFVGIAVIVAVRALLGKVFPDHIADPDPFGANRLNYPITYWNTMALYMSMAFVLGLRVISDSASRLVTRLLYAPALFLFLVVIFYTVSRAGIVLLAFAIGIYLICSSHRLRAVLQTGLAAFWMGVVVAISYKWLPAMIESQPAENLRVSEGHKLGLVLILITVFVTASQWVLIQLEKKIVVPQELGRKIGIALAVAGSAVLLFGFVAYTSTGGRGGPFSWTQARVEAFTSTTRAETTATVEERLFSSQSERYQEWSAAVETFKEHPLIGTGAATWGVGWLKWRPFDMISKDGHSWFFENLSELGLVGAGLMIAFVVVFLMISIRDLRFLKKGRDREIYGAFFAASLALLIHAMMDWDWEMPVIFLSLFMFAGGLLRYGQLSRIEEVQGAAGESAADVSGSFRKQDEGGWSLKGLWGWPGFIGLLCLVLMAVIIPPMISANRMDRVRELERKGDFSNLEQAARSAERFNPFDGEAVASEAKANVGLGRLDAAEQLYRRALDLEPNNDRIWRMLARLYVQKRDVDQAVAAVRMSRQLNPLESQDTGPVEEQVRAIGGVLYYNYIPGGIDIAPPFSQN